MNVNTSYKALLEGRISKSEFLRQARQGLPQYITNVTSFDDAVKILRQKSILSEELIYQNKADKFPLESIQRGIRYELEEMDLFDINSPSKDEYMEARQKAIDNLCKDPLYYIKKVAEQTDQPEATEEDHEGKMYKVELGNKHSVTLKEGKYIQEATPRTQYKDNHNWTVNEYKLAYVLAEFGKQGLGLIGQIYGINNLSLKSIANSIIGTTDAGLRFAIDGIRKVVTNEQDEKWLASYFGNTKALEALRELDRKSMEDCKASISAERCSEEEAAAAQQAQAAIDKKKADGQHDASVISNSIVAKAFENFKDSRTAVAKSIQDPVKADKAAFISVCKNFGYEVDDPNRAVLWAYLRDRINISRQARQELDAKFGVNDQTAPKFKARNLKEAAWSEYSNDPVYTQFYQHYLKKAKEAKDVNADKTARKMAKKAFLKYQEKHAMKEAKKAEQKKIKEMVLKESVIHLIGKILGESKVIEEAATTNLAALSDENASISELPAAINSLENIVTEIESFWLKEQQKIQGVFDSLGNIKNEDGLPIGYKFAQPMMESLKKDLTPVLEKISLDSVKLPEAPAPDQTQVNDPNAEVDPNDPNAVPPVPEKKTVFSPAEKEEPLQENKKNRRYTK